MRDNKKREPKKIKMPPLVDRSSVYDTLSFDNDTLPLPSEYKTYWKIRTVDEDHKQNNSQSIQQLESDSTD